MKGNILQTIIFFSFAWLFALLSCDLLTADLMDDESNH